MQVKIQYPIKRFIAFALMMIIAIGSVVSVMAVTDVYKRQPVPG